MPTREEFESWRLCPTGKWFFELLKEEIDTLQTELAESYAGGEEVGKAALYYANMCGLIDGYKRVRNLDPFDGEKSEAESNRSAPPDQDGR